MILLLWIELKRWIASQRWLSFMWKLDFQVGLYADWKNYHNALILDCRQNVQGGFCKLNRLKAKSRSWGVKFRSMGTRVLIRQNEWMDLNCSGTSRWRNCIQNWMIVDHHHCCILFQSRYFEIQEKEIWMKVYYRQDATFEFSIRIGLLRRAVNQNRHHPK